MTSFIFALLIAVECQFFIVLHHKLQTDLSPSQTYQSPDAGQAAFYFSSYQSNSSAFTPSAFAKAIAVFNERFSIFLSPYSIL